MCRDVPRRSATLPSSVNPAASETCNGQVDEGNPGGGGACNTGLQGVCSVGARVCSSGALVCFPGIAPGSIAEVRRCERQRLRWSGGRRLFRNGVVFRKPWTRHHHRRTATVDESYAGRRGCGSPRPSPLIGAQRRSCTARSASALTTRRQPAPASQTPRRPAC